MSGPEHGDGGTRDLGVEAIQRRLDLIERLIVQSPKFNRVARDMFVSKLRDIRSRLHDGVADAPIEEMDAMFARMLRRLTEFVTRGGPMH